VVQNYNRNVVVVMMSEFGRRAADNATLGTDHGYGNAMFLMGNRINGRQVLSLGTNGLPGWPGLGRVSCFQNLDLNVTLDFRDILGEVCQNLLNDPDLSGPAVSSRLHPHVPRHHHVAATGTASLTWASRSPNPPGLPSFC
jgi:hypothetical protein